MVFQDPFSSLNPVYRVSHGILRSLKLHRRPPVVGRAAGRGRAGPRGRRPDPGRRGAAALPVRVQSGGQRQRVGFAQALACRRKLILADEPVSMLDVSIRIGLLNLMAELREQEGVSFLYITHDIASARYVADRLVIMYAGHIVETGPDRGGAAQPEAPLHPAAAVRGARPARAADVDARRPTRASRRGSSTRRPAAGSAGAARWPSRRAPRSPRNCANWLQHTARPVTWPPRRRRYRRPKKPARQATPPLRSPASNRPVPVSTIFYDSDCCPKVRTSPGAVRLKVRR